MLHKHKAAEAKAQQLAQLAQMREVQKRVSARASALVRTCLSCPSFFSSARRQHHCGTSSPRLTLHAVILPSPCHVLSPLCCNAMLCSRRAQAPRSYALMASGCGSDGEADGGDTEGGAGSKKRPSKKAASKGSARQQLTGFEGCTHLFSDGDVYPAYQQGRCQAFHSGELFQPRVVGLRAHAANSAARGTACKAAREELPCTSCAGREGLACVRQHSLCLSPAAGKVMVLEALLKSIRASEPTDKVVLVSNYTGDSTSTRTHTRTPQQPRHAQQAGRSHAWAPQRYAWQYACSGGGSNSSIAHADSLPVSSCLSAEVLDVLGVMCTSHNWVSLRLDGSCSVKQRQALVDSFNDPTVRRRMVPLCSANTVPCGFDSAVK